MDVILKQVIRPIQANESIAIRDGFGLAGLRIDKSIAQNGKGSDPASWPDFNKLIHFHKAFAADPSGIIGVLLGHPLVYWLLNSKSLKPFC